MTPTPPPETADETTDPLMALVQKWRRQAIEERPRDDEAHASLWTAALDGATGDLRAVMDAFDDPAEITQRRVVGMHPDGALRVHDDDMVRRFGLSVLLRYLDDLGYRDLRVESRTVRTWTSGWRPVPDDTEGE